MPKTMLSMSLESASAPATPIPVAMPTSAPPVFTTWSVTALAPAPRAMRMPISRVRRLTEYDITP